MLTRQTVYRWIARYDGTAESLSDRSKRPHRHPAQHTPEEVEKVLKVQHKRALEVERVMVPQQNQRISNPQIFVAPDQEISTY